MAVSNNRILLWELLCANFKVSGYNSFLGAFWSLLGPAALFLVMFLIFKMRFGQGIPDYPFYLLSGIVCVNFFVITTSSICRIFLVNRDIVLNSTIPREILVLANLFFHTAKFLIELLFCLLLSIFYHIFAWKHLVLVFPLLIAYLGLVLGVSLLLATFFCFSRDVDHIWNIISRIFLFATPIFYRLEYLSPWARGLIYWGNPLTSFLISFRGVLTGGVNIFTYLYSLFLAAAALILGYSVFLILEHPALERI